MISDNLVRQWVNGLPSANSVIILSLLGHKPDGRSEFSFYSFRSEFDADRELAPTFQEWLDRNFGVGRFRVLEYPTIDLEPIPVRILTEVSEKIQLLLNEGETVVLVDSGGYTRTGQVCKHLGYLRKE